VADIQAVYERDAACDRYTQCILYFKGFQAIQCHRIAHWLWTRNRRVRPRAPGPREPVGRAALCDMWMFCTRCRCRLAAQACKKGSMYGAEEREVVASLGIVVSDIMVLQPAACGARH